MTSLSTRIILDTPVSTVILPNTLEVIPTNSFYSYDVDVVIIIPATCKEIQQNAFDSAGKITLIYLGTEDFSQNSMFSSQFSSIKVYVTPYYIYDLFGNIEVLRKWKSSCSIDNRRRRLHFQGIIYLTITVPLLY